MAKTCDIGSPGRGAVLPIASVSGGPHADRRPGTCSCERFARTCGHQPVDGSPFDLGGSPFSGIAPDLQRRSLRRLGYVSMDAAECPGRTDERILEWTGTDFRCVEGIAELPSRYSARISDDAERLLEEPMAPSGWRVAVR